MIGNDLTAKFALDVQGVDDLKAGARANTPEALRAAAQQFEALFMNMLLKSMREATPQDGPFDSEQTRLYTSMLDQQLAQTLSKRGIGLADTMVRQLSPTQGLAPAQAMAAYTSGAGELAPKAAITPEQAAFGIVPRTTASTPMEPTPGKAPAHVAAFVERLLPHARAAAEASGIPARFMLGQAALETGWGRSEMRGADGGNSHNLFGIKAGSGWSGRTVDVVTTEYVNGEPRRQVERFRAYDSYAESFADYARLLQQNERYRPAVAPGTDATGFAQGLQRGGYATDPDYAAKLARTIRLASSV